MNTPPEYDADPATAGLPTSESDHGAGNDVPADVIVKPPKTVVDVPNWLCDVSAMPADIRHQGYSPKRSMLLVWENNSPAIPEAIASGKAPTYPVEF